MSNPIYNKIGKSYNQTRSADPRIVAELIKLLDLPKGSKILDVGAGTGSYSLALSRHGYKMTALEPSAVMSQQSTATHDIEWKTGVAEILPFADGEFDAAIFILCIHHFSDLDSAFREAARVTGNEKVVIFTYDPSAVDSPWLFHYFPVFKDQIKQSFPTISTLKKLLRHKAEVKAIPFPLPHDLQDGFAGAAWRNPERYLEEEYRAGTSAFQMLDIEDLTSGLKQLDDDLTSGAWDIKYASVRTLSEYNHGYTFVVC